jgi:hypothetical protein
MDVKKFIGTAYDVKELPALFEMVKKDERAGMVITTVPVRKRIRKFLLKDFVEDNLKTLCPDCGCKLYVYHYRKRSKSF